MKDDYLAYLYASVIGDTGCTWCSTLEQQDAGGSDDYDRGWNEGYNAAKKDDDGEDYEMKYNVAMTNYFELKKNRDELARLLRPLTVNNSTYVVDEPFRLISI